MLPSLFIDRIYHQFPNEAEAFLASIDLPPATSIRHNSRKSIHNLSENLVPWCNKGEYLDQRPSFTLDPSFHAGKYYVQEASSMFVDWVMKYVKNEIKLDRILDLCAAPGGKSTILLDHLESHQYLVANELIPSRNQVLRENLSKWGYPNFLVTENQPKDFINLDQWFDFILLDAPCSGEGLFRKDKKSILEWNGDLAPMCSLRQEEIFGSIWHSLKDGGYLLYSTCTYHPEENEDFLQNMLVKDFEFETIHIPIDNDWGIYTIVKNDVIGYQFLPHKTKGEGFFCSLIRKKGAWKEREISTSKSHINPWLKDYIIDETLSYSTYKFKNSLYLAPTNLLDDLDAKFSSFYCRQIGLEVGNYKGGIIEPAHGLAMCSFTNQYNEILGVDLSEALDYLSGKKVERIVEDGIWAIQYENQSLGWYRKSGYKFENLYPPASRIRTLLPKS